MTIKRLIINILITISFAVTAKAESHWDPTALPDPYTADTTQYTYDPLGYLTTAGRDSINQVASRLKNSVDIEYAVVVLDKIDDDIFSFSQTLYESWGLGNNDRGILLVVLVEQHQYRFHTGYGVEHIFPDGWLITVGSEHLAPNFRTGNYARGIVDASQQLLSQAIDIDSDFDSASVADNGSSDDDPLFFFLFFYLFIYFFFGGLIFAATLLKLTVKPSETDIVANCKKFTSYTVYTYKINAPNGDVFESYFKFEHLFIRLISIFIIAAIAAYAILPYSEDESDYWFGYLISLVIFPSIILLIRHIYLDVNIRKNYRDNSVEQYNKYNILIHSRKMIFFCIVTPLVSIPALIIFRKRRDKAFDNLLQIPQSEWVTYIGDITQYTDEDTNNVHVFRNSKKLYTIVALSGKARLLGNYKTLTKKKLLLFLPTMILGIIALALLMLFMAGRAKGSSGSRGGSRGGCRSGGGGASGSW